MWGSYPTFTLTLSISQILYSYCHIFSNVSMKMAHIFLFLKHLIYFVFHIILYENMKTYYRRKSFGTSKLEMNIFGWAFCCLVIVKNIQKLSCSIQIKFINKYTYINGIVTRGDTSLFYLHWSLHLQWDHSQSLAF